VRTSAVPARTCAITARRSQPSTPDSRQKAKRVPTWTPAGRRVEGGLNMLAGRGPAGEPEGLLETAHRLQVDGIAFAVHRLPQRVVRRRAARWRVVSASAPTLDDEAGDGAVRLSSEHCREGV